MNMRFLLVLVTLFAVVVESERTTFKIFSYNIKMLPIDPQETIAAKKIRAVEITDKINADPYMDVICFQEVFREEIQEILEKELKSKFPYIIASHGFDAPILLSESGLFFASKYPLLRGEFDPFTSVLALSTDALAEKGLAGVVIDFDGSKVLLHQTHMQAGGLGDAAPVRAAQLRQIRDIVIRRTKQENDSTIALSAIVGDFNVRYGTEEYDGMMDILNEINVADLRVESLRNRSTVDYAFQFENRGTPVFSRYSDYDGLSDHALLETFVEFDKKPVDMDIVVDISPPPSVSPPTSSGGAPPPSTGNDGKLKYSSRRTNDSLTVFSLKYLLLASALFLFFVVI